MKSDLEKLIVVVSCLLLSACSPPPGPSEKKESAPPTEKAKETPTPPKEPEMKPAEKKEEKPAAASQTPPAAPKDEKTAATAPAARQPALLNPALATEKAPDAYKVKLATTKGDVTIEVHRDWAPNGADRFYNLVKAGYFTDIALFRVIDGFMAQFGIHGDPSVNTVWREARIPDDPVKESNKRGFITFATAGPNTRTTQLFINFADNSNLDSMGFAPFGKVAMGMDVIDSIFKGYGEGAPRGRGPAQDRVQSQGNAYLRQSFPNLDYIKSATIAP